MGGSNFLTLSIIAAILHLSTAACAPNSKLLDDILSPANAERALKILRLAAVGARVTPGSNLNVLDDFVPRFVPNTVVPAKKLPDFRRMPLPRQVISQAPVVQDVYQPVVAPIIQEKVYPSLPIPQPCGVSPYIPDVYPSAPVPMVNPFLPAASPVSALAPPTSSLLPPVDLTQVRSNFLRKIPIPPPCL